jgi:hypothetical protein
MLPEDGDNQLVQAPIVSFGEHLQLGVKLGGEAQIHGDVLRDVFLTHSIMIIPLWGQSSTIFADAHSYRRVAGGSDFPRVNRA